MNTYKEVNGNLIAMALNGEFDIIAHGCNCFCTMGAGLAPQMTKAFGCDKFPKEHQVYKGKIDKLGTIDYKKYAWERHSKELWLWDNILDVLDNRSLFVVNAYTQYYPGANLDYEALTLCLRKINHTFKGKHIGLPLIGCGLAGGIWDKNDLPLKMLEALPRNFKDVKTIIQEELKDMNVTVVNYRK